MNEPPSSSMTSAHHPALFTNTTKHHKTRIATTMSQAEFKKRLKALMLLPENQVCSDCPERQPRWASLIVPPPGAPPGSLPMGAFCCLECSGSHRRLGVHISFVRSINLDQWKEKEVLAMENGGNKKVNLIFEAHLNVSKPPNTASGPERERFIRDKYERRKFYDANAFAVVEQMTPGEYNVDPSGEEEQQVIAGVQRRLAAGSSGNGNLAPSIRKPSDAARKRVEERAARNRVAGGVSSSVPAVRSKPVKTPVAPAPVADLLDFGDFDSPEATAAVASSSGGVVNNTASPVAASSNTNEPALDLFASMSVGDTNGAMPPPQRQQQLQQQAQQQKMSTADIMNMFNTPNQNAMQQNNMFAMGGGTPSGMHGGNMMMNQNVNPASYNNMMMPTNNYGGGMNNQMMMNNGMGMQQGNSMLMGGNNMNMFNNQNAMQQNMYAMGGAMPSGMQGGMNNHMMMNNGMGMQQQQQMQMNGMQGGVMIGQGNSQFGQSMPHMSQQQAQKQSRGASHDQFADFGNFGR
ncbi:hypothetical protein ACHAWO_007630 [Cyclotella atomus]|uniref:Arf-GAP domain-containing protein n=1 Tax=Cyclotella atomus TaxID=382360 RepID=A0ABD3Q5J4_9STRA